MKKILSICFGAFFLIAGCASKSDFKSNPNYDASSMDAARDRDYAYCERVAEGRAPSPAMQDIPQNYNVNMYSSTRGYVGSYTVDNSKAAMDASFTNAGAVWGNAIRKKRIAGECMESLGWSKEDITLQANSDANKKRYQEALAHYAQDPLYEETVQVIMLSLQTLLVEGKITGAQYDELLYQLDTDVDLFAPTYAQAREIVLTRKNQKNSPPPTAGSSVKRQEARTN